ncbi:MAG: hypothetical protein UR66_C0001G0090 [Candidatus Moranbacteria bacterium GW2011_GWE1_35_17]|nr:MAG: hypothetical protein UR66_C0001G0090 [Candidatus Moranbacteria bacterium GW2011_GWE1_35_17]
MVKNIIALIGLFLSMSFLYGCAGMLPEKSWTEYKAEQEKIDSSQKNGTGGLQVKKTHIPNDGIKGSVSFNGVGVGAEVYDENGYHGRNTDTTVIKLFGGTGGPDYNKGRRDEKIDARRLKDDQEYQLAIDLAEKHARAGRMSYEGVPGKYHEEYERAYESFEKYSNRRDFNEYRHREYEQGVTDYRAKNPEYGEFAQRAEKLEMKARQDARELRYDLPTGLSRELEQVYYDVFMSECKLSVREKAKRDAKREIFDPPYSLPDLVGYYEKMYHKEFDRSQHGGRKRY